MKNNFITHNGIEYISVRDASKKSGYARDYISRLCRQEKVRGMLVGKNWFVDFESLTSFAAHAKIAASARAEELSRQALRGGAAQKVESGMSNIKTFSDEKIAVDHLPLSTDHTPIIDAPTSIELPPVWTALPLFEQFSQALDSYDAKSRQRNSPLLSDKSASQFSYQVTPLSDIRDRFVALTLTFGLVFSSLSALSPQAAFETVDQTKGDVIALASSAHYAIANIPSDLHSLAHVDSHAVVGAASLPLTASPSRFLAAAASGAAQIFEGTVQSIGAASHAAFGVVTNSFAWAQQHQNVGSESKVATAQGTTDRIPHSTSQTPSPFHLPPTTFHTPASTNQSSPSTPTTIIEHATIQQLAAVGTSQFVTRTELSGLLDQFSHVAALIPQNTNAARDFVVRQIDAGQRSIGNPLADFLPLSGGTLTGGLAVSGATTIAGMLGVGTTSPSDTLAVQGPVYLADVSAPSNSSHRLYSLSGALYWNGTPVGSSGGSGGAFSWTPTTFGSTLANATSTLIGFNAGLYALASSTIGDGTPAGGLTISGGATTTGAAYFSDSVSVGSVSSLLSNFASGHSLLISKSGTIAFATENTKASSASQGSFGALYSNDGSAMASGDRLGGFIIGGNNGSFLAIGARIASYATEDWSGSGNGARLTFETTANGDTTLTEKMTILGNGNVGIGTTTPGSLLSLNNIANFSTATSTFYSTGGINLTSGCFSINGVCVTGGGTGSSASSTLLADNNTFSGNNIFTHALSLSGATGTTTIASGQGFTIGTSQFVFQQGSGNVGIGTTPTANLTVYQSSSGVSSSKGVVLTGSSVGGTSSGTGALWTLGYNAVSNKQFWLGDPDYAGLSTGSFIRFSVITGVPQLDAVRGDNAVRTKLFLGDSGDSGSDVVVLSPEFGIGTSTPGSLLSLNGIANFTTATSTFYSTGGINIAGGCFSINGVCVGGGGGGVGLGANTWTGLQTLSQGFISQASSTIGNGSLGLTIAGDATTTGRILIGGTASSSLAQLSVMPSTTTISKVGSVTSGLSAPIGIFVQGRYAYIADAGNSSLVIMDVSDPSAPIKVSSISSDLVTPRAVYVSGRYAYVGSENNSKFVIFDISNPAVPMEVSSISSDVDHPYSIYVQGRYAYVVDHNVGKVVIFDVANPASPVEVSAMTVDLTQPQSVYVQGRYAYIADIGAGKLVIYDISNPASPAEAGSITTGLTSPAAVYVQGRYAYVGDVGSGLVIFDISNPASPSKAGAITTGLSFPNAIMVQGRYAYVTDLTTGFVTFDVSNPGAPMKVSAVATGLSSARNAYVAGRYAYVTSLGNASLVTFDLGGGYLQQLEAGSLEAGSLNLRSNLSAVDGIFSGGLGIGGSLQVAGAASILASGSTFNTTANIFNIATASSTNSIFSVFGNGNVGIGTTTPSSILSVQGVANFAIATSTFYSTGGINLIGGGCFSINSVCVGGGGVSGSSASSTLLADFNTWTNVQKFSGGIFSAASSTIGNGTQAGGLTIFGSATTTGTAYFAGNVGIGSSSPSAALSFAASTVKAGGISFGDANANLYRTGSNAIKTDGTFTAGQGITSTSIGGTLSGSVAGGINLQITGGNIAGTSGDTSFMALTGGGAFSPSTGSGTYEILNVGNGQSTTPLSVNQTGSATGISRGIYINPTITKAADFRAFETIGYTYNLGAGATPTTAFGSLFNPYVLASTTAGTIANAQMVTINGAPIAATNVTISTSTALAIIASSTTAGGTVTNGIGLMVQAPTGATNNYSALFLGGNVGIGTTSPSWLFTVQGTSTAASFYGYSTTATTTLNGGFTVGSGAINYDLSSGVTTINNLATGAWAFDTNAGQVSWADLPIDSTATAGTVESYTAQIGGLPILTVYAEADGSGNAQNTRVGIGTTSPLYTLDVASTTFAGGVARFSNSNGSCVINPNTTSLSCASDARLKKNIISIEDVFSSPSLYSSFLTLNSVSSTTTTSTSALAQIMRLNPVFYNWNSEATTSAQHAGFIAQQVLPIFPDLVSSSGGYYSLNYGGFSPYLVAAIQEIVNISGAFKDHLIAWFASPVNGITDFFANRVHTKEICVGDPGNETCISKTQLDAMLAGAGASASHSDSPSSNDQVPSSDASSTPPTSDASSTPPVTPPSDNTPPSQDTPPTDPAPTPPSDTPVADSGTAATP